MDLRTIIAKQESRKFPSFPTHTQTATKHLLTYSRPDVHVPRGNGDEEEVVRRR